MEDEEIELKKFYKEQLTQKQREFLLKHKEEIGFDESLIDTISLKEATSLIGIFLKCKEQKKKMIDDNKRKIQNNYKELLNNKFFENQNNELSLLERIDRNIEIIMKKLNVEGETNHE